MKKILYITRDDGGCGYFRCVLPARVIKEMGLADTEVVMRTPTDKQLLGADLVIMQELGSTNATDIARFCRQNKIPYMTEIDDFLQHVSPRNTGGYSAWNPSTLFVHRSMELSRSAFAMQVSTNQLAREYFPYHPTIYVVPNYLDRDLWENPTPKRGDGKIRIGWFGGNAHGDDLHMISKVLEDIVKEFKGKVVFETIGMTEQELQGCFKFRKMKDECPSCGFEGDVHHFPGESLQNYPMLLAGRGWDIALAPVIENGFGNAKSNLKLMEYSAAGIPIVASPVVPYREAVSEGCAVRFATTYEEWYTAIKDLIKRPKIREEMAAKNKAWVSRYWIQDNAQRIFGVYNDVITRAEQMFGKKEDHLLK